VAGFESLNTIARSTHTYLNHWLFLLLSFAFNRDSFLSRSLSLSFSELIFFILLGLCSFNSRCFFCGSTYTEKEEKG